MVTLELSLMSNYCEYSPHTYPVSCSFSIANLSVKNSVMRQVEFFTTVQVKVRSRNSVKLDPVKKHYKLPLSETLSL